MVNKKKVLITGAHGLIGSESAKFFAEQGFSVIGVDNDMRAYFFGKEASTDNNLKILKDKLGESYIYYKVDIRDFDSLKEIFLEHGGEIKIVIHTAAQPSHDWAAREPLTDFSVNAQGTMNALELTRQFCPEAVFIFTSTNKVYGDTPNYLPLVELEERYEIDKSHMYFQDGIDEHMTIDQSKHSIFGASKVAADVMVQEYGKYFKMKTAVFRGGCLTGPAHAGAQLHGFLSYLVHCAVKGKSYTVFGYKGKQVRDNIHSYDLVNAFWHFYNNPRSGEVYNMGGSRHSNVSVIEAIRIIKEISGHELKYKISEDARIGDHVWYISDVRKFRNHYPDWDYKFDLRSTLKDMIEAEEKDDSR